MSIAVLPLVPLSCGASLLRIGDRWWGTVAVKATLALAHGGDSCPVEPVTLQERDEHGSDGRVVAASDVLPIAQGAGVVLIGVAHAPGGRPIRAMSARLALYRGAGAILDKRLAIYGDRTRLRTEPTPFTSMAITYARAFGGADSAENPIGVDRQGALLPNIVDPIDPDRTAGFGPIARGWAPRAQGMREIEAAIVRDGGFVDPAAIDWTALHAAPVDQRIERIVGDEWIVLDGFHAQIPRIQTRLPAARAEARAVRLDGQGALVPIDLVADTMTIDVERFLVSIVWRGRLPLATPQEAEAIRIYAGLETHGRAIRWPEAPPRQVASGVLDDAAMNRTGDIDIRGLHSTLPFSDEPASSSWLVGGSSALEDVERDLDSTAELRGESRRPALPFSDASAAGVVVAAASPRPFPEPPPLHVALVDDSDEGDTIVAPAPAAAPIFSAEHAALRDEVVARVSGKLGMEGLALVGADLSGLDLAGANFRKVDLAGAKLSGAKLEGASFVGAALVGADLRGARLAKADFSGSEVGRAVFDGATLDDASFRQARGEGTRFVTARGGNVSFVRATFDGADFSDADLANADFTGASIVGARFQLGRFDAVRLGDAQAAKASFDGARLADARGEGAVLNGASFALAEAPRSKWDAAELTEASFGGAKLERASFARARASKVSFRDADLAGADFGRLDASEADLSGVSAREIDLRRARLDGAQAQGANFRGARADHVQLRGAALQRVDFSGASLREAKLEKTDLSGARLDGADLRDADLEGANLAGATLQKAKLAGARGVTAESASGGEVVRDK
jgi:uncharacterized protein YjbI with pentapeptide repeats